MTNEVEVQEGVATEEHDQQAFEAGFNDEAEAQATAQPEVQEAQETEQVEQPAEESTHEADDRNEYGFTKDEMRALLTKAAKVDEIERKFEETTQRIHGKFGEFNRTIQQMQSTNRGAPLTSRQLNHLRGEFPELAALLEKDLGEAVAAPQAQEQKAVQAFDPSVIEQRTAQVEDKLTKQMETKLLTAMHPDWRDIVNSDDWKAWKALHKPDEQRALDSSWDANFLAGKFSNFKQWRSSATVARTKKTSRLEAAVTPQGVGAPASTALDDEAAFLAGFNSN